jgi:branched-chain amino acid transport system ATP-binding protein
MTEPLLAIRDLAAGYGAVSVLRGVSLEVHTGSITALLGSNGAGKTTLMRCIAGLVAPRGGALAYAGEEIAAWPSHRRVQAGITLVPEGRLVFPDLTVEENLRLGGITLAGRGAAAAELRACLDLFPRLAERRRQAAGSLSGGEQQMLALARGLMARPRLLLLDEPTLGLAPQMVAAIFRIVADLRQRGLTILLAEQNVMSTLELADSAYVLENGRTVLAGPAAAVLANPRVREAYLGL